MNVCKTSDGFTLVEIMVMTCIVVILIVMVLPSMTKGIALSQSAGCLSNLRKWGNAINLYSGEHEGKMPPRESFQSDPNNSGQYIALRSNPRIPDWALQYSESPLNNPVKMVMCPGDRSPRNKRLWYYVGYLMNPYTFIVFKDGIPDPTSADNKFIRLDEVQNKILLADSIDAVEAVSLFGSNGMSLCNVSEEMGAGGGLNINEGIREKRVSRKHSGNANALFGNGSVQALRWDQMSANYLLRPDQL